MAGTLRRLMLAVVLGIGLVTPHRAAADGWCWPGMGYSWPAYSYSYPDYYYPPPQVVYVPQTLATPTPAPPSQPTISKKIDGRKPPTVIESRWNTTPASGMAPAKDTCRVGFWNLTGRDVQLKVDGTSHSVPRERAVTLTLPRSFTWQVGDEPARTERVPASEATHEVVIRP